MTRSLFADAFGHHVWATERVFDACAALTDDQLATTVPGTYGSILDTLRHLVGADRAYLFVLTGGRLSPIDEAGMDLSALRHAMATADSDWTTILATAGDPDDLVVRRRDDGTESHAPRGIRLAQAIHHGTDHRSQICTALTTIGIEPPAIDVWDYGEQDGRVSEVPSQH
jgi:uncharacterized damage-inducible protein DinB